MDRTDTKRAIAQHQPDGETYIVEYCSVWEDDNPIGTQITAAAGPINHGDLPSRPADGPTPELYDAIDDCPNLTDEDADWLQVEDEAGRLVYPIGAR
ncbi:MAG: hypothetical protein C4534_02080 [Gaiellales bacterium]|nr:MAG: hypothetical protein C4534_02080 [Gaiellales bacterium]